jgi:hypothetical protein
MSRLPFLEAALWLVGGGVGLFALDRLLLWVESRGWIYYRKSRPGRGASTYHLFQWSSILDPTVKEVLEERVREEREEEVPGAPPGPDLD